MAEEIEIVVELTDESIQLESVLEDETIEMELALDTNVSVTVAPSPDIVFGGQDFLES